MKIIFTFLGLLLLMVNFGVARQQQNRSESCGFDVQGEPAQPTITGPDDIVPLVYVVEQPDSPIEVVSVDLQGMWLSVSDDQYTYKSCAKYEVRNRSNRVIHGFDIELALSTGASNGVQSSSQLAPGQSVEVKACNGRGSGNGGGNHLRLLLCVRSVDFGDCFYRPSLRIPRSLGVGSPW